MKKRGIFSEKERKFAQKAEQGHALFRHKMLSAPADHIYGSCQKILFHESLYTYFRYKEAIPEELLAACLKEPNIFTALWDLYAETEYLKMETWEDIDELLAVFLSRRDGSSP